MKKLKVGESHIAVALLIVSVSVFTLFYIFDNVNKVAERCQTESLQICRDLSGLTLPMLIILLMVGGLIFVSLTVVYILISA